MNAEAAGAKWVKMSEGVAQEVVKLKQFLAAKPNEKTKKSTAPCVVVCGCVWMDGWMDEWLCVPGM